MPQALANPLKIITLIIGAILAFVGWESKERECK
jgi:hypothetical protein